MDFSISSSLLANKLSSVGKVVNNKNSLAILSSIVFSLKDEELKLYASDGEIWIESTLPLGAPCEEYKFAVDATSVIQGIKEIPDQPIYISADLSSNKLTVVHQSGKFSIAITDASNFPIPSMIDGDIIKQISKSRLLASLNQCGFSISKNELRPVMQGTYFDFTGECLTVVATDGHSLVRQKYLDIQSEVISAFNMPVKVSVLLRGILNSKEGTAQFHFDGRNTEVVFDDFKITFRLIEGRYPNYNAVIPSILPYSAVIDRVSLYQSLKRLMSFCSASSYLVKFQFEQDKLVLSAEDFEFAKIANETIKCDYNSKSITMGFKLTALMDILKNLQGQNIKINMVDCSKAALIVPEVQKENEEVTMLLMPMIIND